MQPFSYFTAGFVTIGGKPKLYYTDSSCKLFLFDLTHRRSQCIGEKAFKVVSLGTALTYRTDTDFIHYPSQSKREGRYHPFHGSVPATSLGPLQAWGGFDDEEKYVVIERKSSGMERKLIPIEEGFSSITSEGNLLVTLSCQNEKRLTWIDLKTGKQKLKEYDRKISKLAAHDGVIYAIVGKMLYRTSEEHLLPTKLKSSDQISCINTERGLVVGGYSGVVERFDLKAGKRKTLANFKVPIWELKFALVGGKEWLYAIGGEPCSAKLFSKEISH